MSTRPLSPTGALSASLPAPLFETSLIGPSASRTVTFTVDNAFAPAESPALSLKLPTNEWGSVRFFAPTVATPLPASTPLEEALATVDPEKIKKDVFWIAADERGGRDTPSTGLSETAGYIRDRLQSLGWRGGAQNDGYFYRYKTWGGGFFKTWEDVLQEGGLPADDGRSLDAKRADLLKRATGLAIGGAGSPRTFAYGEDYFYSSLRERSDARLTGEIAVLGEARRESFTEETVKDKWVVVYEHPEIAPEERRDWAKAAGAKGLIVLPHPQIENVYLETRLHKLQDMAQNGTLQYSADCAIDEIMFTKEGAERFWKVLQTASVNAQGVLGDAAAPLTLTDNRVLKAPFGLIEADNVVGFWKGSDPELSKEVIILSAHYDHVGKRGSTVYNGADDNGSGTSGLLALAEAITKLNPKRSVMIMWVSGEEKGLLGSEAWVKSPYFPDGVKPIADINIDMIGRNDDARLDITPSSRHTKYNGLVKFAEQDAATEGFGPLGSADDVYTRSDHYMFSKLGIPIAFLTSGLHADYHKPTDDPEKINTGKIARVARLILRMLDRMQADDLKL